MVNVPSLHEKVYIYKAGDLATSAQSFPSELQPVSVTWLHLPLTNSIRPFEYIPPDWISVGSWNGSDNGPFGRPNDMETLA